MILGIVSLLLMLFTNKFNKERMKLSIQEITYINEMALTIGLVGRGRNRGQCHARYGDPLWRGGAAHPSHNNR
jgi:hypothetical protein